jgi:homoserine dehydrogenase
MLQRGRAPDEVVPVVITTHGTEGAATTHPLARIGGIEAVIEPLKRVRIEAPNPQLNPL